MGADLSQFVNKTVVMQNDHGKNLSFDGSRYTASPNQGGWEQWVLQEAERNREGKVTSVYVHNAAHDVRLSAHDDRRTLTGSKNRSGWEKWVVESAGDRFYLKSAHGTYLNQGSDGSTLQSKNRGGSELWRLVPTSAPAPAPSHHAHPVHPVHPAHHAHPVHPVHPVPAPYVPAYVPVPMPAPYVPAPTPAYVPAYVPAPVAGPPTGRFYLTNGNNHQQLQADDRHNVGISANKGGWEVWTLENHGGKTVICGAHGRNLQVDDHGRIGLSPNKGGWEQFTLKPAAGGKWIIVAHTGNTLGRDTHYYCKNRNEGGWEQWTLTPA